MKNFWMVLLTIVMLSGCVRSMRPGEAVLDAYMRERAERMQPRRMGGWYGQPQAYATPPNIGLVDGPSAVCQGDDNPRCLTLHNQATSHYVRCWLNGKALLPSTRFARQLMMPVQTCAGGVQAVPVLSPRFPLEAVMYQPRQRIYCEFYVGPAPLQMTHSGQLEFRQEDGRKHLWLSPGREPMWRSAKNCTDQM